MILTRDNTSLHGSEARVAEPPRVYDSRTPVLPAWDGEIVHHGIRMIAGREHVAAAVDELLSRACALAADIETCGTSPALSRQIKEFTTGIGDLVVSLDPRDAMQRLQITRVLERAPELIFHNAAFDVPLLVGDGLVDVEVVERTYCTLVTARLGLPGRQNRRGLGELATRLLGLETGDIESVFKAAGYKNRGQGYELMDIDSSTYLMAAMMDTAVTARLRPVLEEAVVAQMTTGHPYTTLALDRAGALAELERQQTVNRVMLRSSIRGFLIDEDYYEQYVDDQTRVMADAEKALKAAGLSPGHGPSLAQKLDADGALPAGWKRTPKTGSPSAEKDQLQKLAGHPIVDAHLTYTGIKKDLNDYMNKLLDFARADGRVHPQIHVLGADSTGRVSGANPPIQQFSDTGRQMVLADDPGGWVSIDWTSVEPMIAAFTSGELGLSQAILDGQDTYVPVGRAAGLIPDDVPDADAKDHSGRKAAKVVLLGLMYGKGVALLASELGTNADTAAQIKADVLGGVPHIGTWMRTLADSASRSGLTLTAAGRIIPVGQDFQRSRERGCKIYKGYLAQNYYHQGSAYDALADALVEIHRQGLAPHVRISMHDELVVAAEAGEAIAEIMRHATGSLARFLTAGNLAERVPGLLLPTDTNLLPERWMKV